MLFGMFIRYWAAEMKEAEERWARIERENHARAMAMLGKTVGDIPEAAAPPAVKGIFDTIGTI